MCDKNFYYVVDSGSSEHISMFADIKKADNARQLSYVFDIKNPVLRLLNKIHMSIKINTIIELPFKHLWDKYYVMERDSVPDDVTKWIIVSNWSVRRFSKSYLDKMSRDKNTRLVLLYLDPLSGVTGFYKKQIARVKFDLIYSFDKMDCCKYGWIHTASLYSKKDIDINPTPENDIYFIGLDKGRKEIVEEIYDKFTKAGIKCDFNIVTENFKCFDNGMGLKYLNHRLDYDDVLKGIANSKAILEIVQDGQSGMTMRPYEALFYDRKLLTNNRELKKMPFYNEKYMYVFDGVKDINADFLLRNDKAEYGYNGEYSPVEWIKKLPQDFENLSKK